MDRMPIAVKDKAGNAAFYVEATVSGEQPVAFPSIDLEDLKRKIQTITVAVREAIQNVAPTKASVEFGIELGIKEGKLLAGLVQGSAKGNLKVTLEWSETKNS